MLPPNKVKIGYREFRITTAPLRDRYGECDKEKGDIFYAPGQKPDLRLNTIIHELLHGAWEVGGLEDSDTEERVVTILANQISGMLQDNPELVQWINKMLENSQ
jgi:hypothetical protein